MDGSAKREHTVTFGLPESLQREADAGIGRAARKRRGCTIIGCKKGARGATNFCTAHGGGKRCQQGDCTQSARGATNFCTAHGGGKRCQQGDCTQSARGATKFCYAHGGGNRCQQRNCTQGALGATNFCSAHAEGWEQRVRLRRSACPALSPLRSVERSAAVCRLQRS